LQNAGKEDAADAVEAPATEGLETAQPRFN